MLKRVFDLALASLFLVFTAPVLLLIALLIKLESPGSAFTSSARTGKGGKVFALYAFRTKHANQFTHVGRFIHQFCLDELPQFVNVLFSDMTILE